MTDRDHEGRQDRVVAPEVPQAEPQRAVDQPARTAEPKAEPKTAPKTAPKVTPTHKK